MINFIRDSTENALHIFMLQIGQSLYGLVHSFFFFVPMSLVMSRRFESITYSFFRVFPPTVVMIFKETNNKNNWV